METLTYYYQLTKPRLSLLSAFSGMMGFIIAPKLIIPSWEILYFLLTAFAITLCAAGAAVLNQWMESSLDGMMQRTKDRPLPRGKINHTHALFFGMALSILGLFILYYYCSLLSFGVALLTLFSYLLIYTPMKRVSPINTVIGAFPGSLPPLIGWSAASGTLSLSSGLLFAILFFWQMPHFYALAWMYKEDYASAGFKMLSLKDKRGEQVATRSFLYTVLLLVTTVLPFYLGLASVFYLCVVILVNFFIGVRAYNFLSSNNKTENARKLFLASIIYLPIVLIILAIDMKRITLF
tara:strand:+ start:769 stop:1650 length:882 start_codon:yes stop_codon:yes gene_type:complete